MTGVWCSRTRKRGADAAVEAGAGGPVADGVPLATDGVAGEEPLGARVARLFPELQGGATDGAAAAAQPITADSLTVLLTQAVNADDKVRRRLRLGACARLWCSATLCYVYLPAELFPV